MKIDVLTVERRLVDLEVPRVQHDAGRRMDRHRHAVRHAVRDAQELHGERADLDAVARRDGPEPRLRVLAALRQLRLDQRERQRRAVHRAVHVRQHVRDRADVILVPVRQHQRLDPVLLELPQIRDDQIDAEQVRLRKHHTGIDHDGRPAAGDDHHVHAELAEPAERDQFERRRTRRRRTVDQIVDSQRSTTRRRTRRRMIGPSWRTALPARGRAPRAERVPPGPPLGQRNRGRWPPGRGRGGTCKTAQTIAQPWGTDRIRPPAARILRVAASPVAGPRRSTPGGAAPPRRRAARARAGAAR